MWMAREKYSILFCILYVILFCIVSVGGYSGSKLES
jgi:hypothetical protein